VSVATADEALDAVAEFLDVAGHELRNPIASLKGHAQLFRRRVAKQEGREADVAELDKMLYQVERIEHELDVYLEAARLQRRRVHLTPDLCDLADLVRKLVDLYSHSVGGHDIRLELGADTLFGTWDKRRLRMAIEVLLANAVKYGREQEVLVRLLPTAEGARVEVLDRGIGVPGRERQTVFKAYARGTNVENGGVGLGLYVARELVRRHGGRIGVAAREGGGSVFWLELPLRVPEKASRRRDQEMGDEERVAEPVGAARPHRVGA
jgi:signal transduction histidine kinase